MTYPDDDQTVDPFADPFSDPSAGTRTSPTSTPTPSRPVRPVSSHPAGHTQTTAPAAPSTTSAAATSATGNSDLIPCPCSCNCGNSTDKTYAEIDSLSAARHLRCAECAAALHFGPRWTPEESQPAGGAADKTVTGRNGTSFVIRQPHIDPEDEEWNRQIAERLANERREAARTRWLERLPERWQLPYNDGEDLVPEVEDRLERLKHGAAADHGTSLVCIGPFGSGKTWVAYTYARAAVDRNLLWPQEIRIGTEAEIMEPIALASPWEVAARSNELLTPTLKLLIIDDVGALGTYKNQENRYATWTKVVNWMYEHKRALVLTTNRTLGTEEQTPPKERDALLERWIGPTAYERLKHMVGEHQVFRDENKRAEMTRLWEAEYQAMQATRTID